MALRLVETEPTNPDDDHGQELVDAVVAAIDERRTDEVARVRAAMELLGLGETFDAELRLAAWAGDETEILCWSCRQVAA